MAQGIWNKRLSRRSMLGGIAGSAAAAILAACGGSNATNTPASQPTTAAGTSSTTAAGSSVAATRPAGSGVTGTPAAGSTTASSTTAVGSVTTGTTGTTAAGTTTTGTTGATGATYSPQGTKSPNFASTQTLRLQTTDDPKTLDPAVAQYSDGIAMLHLMYDSLFSFDDKGALVPRAAAVVPTQQNGGISADGKTYTIKLRLGQKFSDGSPVTANDYVYAAKRFVDPTLASPYSSFASSIAGYAELNASGNEKKSKQELQPLFDKLGIAAKDDTTLQFTLADVQPTFPQILSLWGFIPLKQGIVDKGGANWWQDPKNHVTNGAWTLDSFQSKQKLTFVPNANYTGEKPYLQRVEISVIADAAQIFNAYQNNELDVIAVPRGNRQQVLSDSSFKDQLIRSPNLTTWDVQFNNKMAPFNNPAVRKAFATAFDRKAFIQDVNKGLGTLAFSFVAKGEPGYSDTIGQQYAFDATKAKKILADAGVDLKSLNGIKQLHSTAGDAPTIAQWIQAQLKANLGIDTQLDPVDSKTRQQRISAQHDYQFTFAGWGADYPDPEDWLPELFGSKGGNNDSQYSNPQVDALFAQAKTEQNNEKRLALYNQAQQIIIDTDAAIAPIYYVEAIWLRKPKLIGVTANPMDGNWIGDQYAFRGFQFTK
jgi:oligopeptide transport system substrate-binding protein